MTGGMLNRSKLVYMGGSLTRIYRIYLADASMYSRPM